MDNQHRKISGYRELNQQEIDMMNEAKELLRKVKALDEKIFAHLNVQHEQADEIELARLENAMPYIWNTQGRINIETGFMQLIRSIAQPGM